MIRKIMILMLGIIFSFGGFSAWAQDNDAIIDIDNHVATPSHIIGTWGTNNTPILFYGDDFRWAACSGSDTSGGTITAEWIFDSNDTGITVDITGEYAVYVRWVAHSNRTDSARYRIYDGATYVGGCTYNQQSRGGEWVYCNTVNLTLGNAAVVKLGNNCETGKYVIADAVRFVRVSKDKNDIVDEPGIDFNKNTSGVTITSTSKTSPTELISRAITCPRSGYVWAFYSSELSYYASTYGDYAFVLYSISTSTSWDDYNVQQTAQRDFSTSSSYVNRSALAIQRLANCTAGQSITFRVFATKGSSTNAYVFQPTLTLMYFPTAY